LAFVLADLAIPISRVGMLKPDAFGALRLLAIAALAVSAALAVQASAVALTRARIPFAEPASVLLVVFDFSLVLLGAEDSAFAADRRFWLVIDNWLDGGTARAAEDIAALVQPADALVAEMLEGRLVSFQIDAGGALSARQVWARLQDLVPPTPKADAYNGPDGLKLGPDGNYYIAQNGSGRLLVAGDDKKLIRTISVPTPYVTNVAFEGKSVFITGAFEQWQSPFAGAVYRWSP